MELDASLYHLSSRIKLRQIAPKHIGVVKHIKSRIIQKDALKIVAIAKQIKSFDASVQVSLICSNNICSKSLALLASEGLAVVFE